MFMVIHCFSIIKVAEEVSKNLASLKEVLCGTGDKEPQTEADDGIYCETSGE